MPLHKPGNRKDILIMIIYAFMMIFFIFKMIFYAQFVGRFPDEITQISYIAYLEKYDVLIPEFKDMAVLQQTGTLPSKPYERDKYEAIYGFGDTFNQLGHPPLYYHLMRLTGGVRVEGDQVFISIKRLRGFNMLMAALTLLLIFYMGWSRLGKNPVIHLLYAAICVSVPMLAYISAGVNNDNLAFVGVTLLVFGLLRFSEKKRNLSTYLLIAFGTSVSLLAKLTAGMIAVSALAIYLLIILVRERSLKFLISKSFLLTLPVYIAPMLYFIAVYHQTGSIQPTYRILDPVGFYSSSFYVDPAHRRSFSFNEYVLYFSDKFFSNWASIRSHVSLLKTGSFFTLQKFGLCVLWVIPILTVFMIFRKKLRHPAILAAFTVYCGMLITAVVQCLRAYYEFIYISGYLGGTQTRYYLCGISAIALAVAIFAKTLYGERDALRVAAAAQDIVLPKVITMRDAAIMHETAAMHASACRAVTLNRALVIEFIRKASVSGLSLALTGLIIYEDFIYFLINFNRYL